MKWKKRCAIAILVVMGLAAFAGLTVIGPYYSGAPGGWTEVWQVQALVWSIGTAIGAFLWAIYQLDF